MSKTRCCVVCSSVFHLPMRESRYLHESTPFICSAQCLKDLILSYPIISEYRRLEIQKRYMPYSDFGEECRQEIWSRQFNCWFGSRYEEEVAIFLDKIGIPFEREKYCFPIGHTIYLPDNYLYDRDVFLEVKGVWLNRSRAKIKKFREKYPDQKFILVPYTLRDSILRYCRNGSAKCQGNSEEFDPRKVRYLPR